MRTDELIKRARYSAHIGDGAAFPDYDDAWMLLEMTDKLQTVFEDIVTKTRQGYWLKQTILTTSNTRARYRVPYRAVAGGFEKIEIAQTSLGPWTKLELIPASMTSRYEVIDTSKGYSSLYTMIGDQIELIPAPDQAYALRISYYLRPSALVTQQSSTASAGTVRGQITAINTAARQVTVNTMPFDMSLSVPVVITNATLIDIVHPNGWHELSLVNATQTSAVNVITIGGTDSLDDIEIGDFVRQAEQTDWPCIPDDFHRCLADIAAIKVMTELKTDSTDVANNVQADMIKFRSILEPRGKADPQVVPATLSGGSGGWGRY